MNHLPDADALVWLMCKAAFDEDDGLPRWPLWMLDAACLAADPAAFFLEKGESAAPAVAICQACTVRAACLEYALTFELEYSEHEGASALPGVWGGTTPKQRRAIHRERGNHRQPSPPSGPAVCGTARGYSAHRHRGEDPCRPCMDAKAEYQRERKRERTARSAGAA